MQHSLLLQKDDWHPLSGHQCPDYIPPAWDGPHVGKRLIEALQTLRRLPAQPGPRQYGNAWPDYVCEFHDQIAQIEADEEQKAADARAQNWVRIMPSAQEIGQMEQAIVWPARYLKYFPQLLRTVSAIALARSRGLDIAWCARRRLLLPARLARRWNREGLDAIAAGLRRDQVAIF